MKKTITYLAFTACIIIFTACTPNYNDNSTPRLEINGKKFLLEVARSDSKQAIGLSNKKELSAGGGMIFLYDKSSYLQFWMKDTLIPLQIIFVNGCEIVDIQEMAVEKDPANPQKIYRSQELADKAIEVNRLTFQKEIVGQKVNSLCNI